jgi:hypothetical protein
MHRLLTRALVAGAGCLAGAAASAAPVSIDSEQKAAASLITAFNVQNNTPIYQNAVLERAVFYTGRALSAAASVTTPGALMANPAGVEVPCEVSGTMTAKMSPRFPRVVKFEWHDCHLDIYGWPHSLDGPGEVLLQSDSFTATKALAIRLGNSRADFVQTREVVTPDQVNHDTILRNLTLVGNIPLNFGQFQPAGSTLSYAYVLDGYVDETQVINFPLSGAPQQTLNQRWDLEALTYAGSIGVNENWTVFDEELKVLFGTFTLTSTSPAPYGTQVERSRYANYRLHTVTDYTGWTRDASIDGKVDYTWNPNFGAGCVSGGYNFRTVVPLRNDLSAWQQFSAGALDINGSMRATFYTAATVPPSLPSPTQGVLTHVEVNNVGTFDYDAWSVSDGLRGVAGCM